MNYLAQMLSTGPTLTSKQVKSSTTVRKSDTPEARAKLRATVQKKRRTKWRAYFAQFPDMTATTTQLSNACGQAPSPTHLILKKLSLEENPVVARAGTTPPSRGNGKDQIIWKWIGD